ncbi:uncharacterized protein LOC134851977 [Symsagittifera roscoffensis]|uniref:uncharacterized protein LOC134851977 n=1 Tax=Symsagittifera roscoffensis TaxID=84072 RepID=UPI00307BD19F
MEMTNWNLKILNLTETTTSRTIVHEESQIVWLAATDYLELSGTVISLIGILLNYFCFLTADKLPKSSSASLMKHAAFWDSVSAMNNGVVKMGLQQLGLDLDNLSDLSCRFVRFVFPLATFLAVYHVVLLAVDRIVIIKAQVWHRKHYSPNAITKISGTIIMIGIFINTPNIVFYSMLDGRCQPITNEAMTLVAVGIFGLVLFVLPFIILIVCNFFFVWALNARETRTNTRQTTTTGTESTTVHNNRPTGENFLQIFSQEDHFLTKS